MNKEQKHKARQKALIKYQLDIEDAANTVQEAEEEFEEVRKEANKEYQETLRKICKNPKPKKEE